MATSKITASYAFFEALWDAGIKYCFVNLGNDHPALLEAMIKGQSERPNAFPTMVTCPNEMVALSMADGYARLTNQPQCVIVHVDVGTQGLGAAVHNASTGRAPVLIFAGLSPYTIEGELKGSRTEFIHWLQDVPDQKQIVSQYCRYTAEIKTGHNVKQMVNRALQMAMSAPQGPSYLCASREVMEELIEPYSLNQAHWDPVEPAALSDTAVATIADALWMSRNAMLITGYTGRNHNTVPLLVRLADMIKGLRVLDTGGCDVCFPADHPAYLALSFGIHEQIKTADVILVIDCDVPWVNTFNTPRADAKIFHIDVDPLKQQIPTFYLAALARYRADAFTSLSQLTSWLLTSGKVANEEARRSECRALLQSDLETRIAAINTQGQVSADDTFGCVYLAQTLRKVLPVDTIFAVEAVTSTVFIASGLQPVLPGSWINCGGGGLGWSGGGALGIKLATDTQHGGRGNGKFVVQIVGDGSFLFSVPASVYWIAQRYSLPILTIVLNNKGWNAPKRSLSLVHPNGNAMKATNEELNLSFGPYCPDYSGIAKASAGGHCFAEKVSQASQLHDVLSRAVQAVQQGTTAVVDAVIASGC